MPDSAVPRVPADLASLTALLAARLHAAGLPVGPRQAARLAAAVEVAGPVTVRELYWCARVTLVSGPEQLDRFDAVFAAVFGGLVDVADVRGEAPRVPLARPHHDRGPVPGGARTGSPAAAAARAAGHQPEPASDGGVSHPVPALASSLERLATTDFAALSAEELAALLPVLQRLALQLPQRSSRRRRRSPTGDRLDVRATLRRSHRSGGDPAVTVRRRRRRRPRRLVALLDISGSMEPYARAYLQLLWAAATEARAETFLFATRLTRVTAALRNRNPDAALAQAAQLAPDWSGGTRIGLAVKAFLDRYGRRGLARGAVVLVVSDGWERDDPAVLEAQMAALSRLAHRIIWVNPRVAAPGFEPRVGGMLAARPYVDALVSGHTAAALGEVLDAIAAPTPPVRRAHDPAGRGHAPPVWTTGPGRGGAQ